MKIKRLSTLLGMMLIMVLVSACGFIPTFGSRALVSETRQVGGFDRVELSGGGSMDILQDGTESLSIETDDNMMEYVTSEVRGGTLVLGLDSSLRSLLPSRLHFTLHVKDLAGINTSGSWELVSESIRSGSLAILTSGSSKVVIHSLAVDYLDATVSGSGLLNLGGVVKQETFDISGSARVLAGDLHATTATVNISGSGDVTVWATETLAAYISGSGDISYYGNPQLSFELSGSGKLHNLGARE